MFPADLSRTARTAVLDDGAEARTQFATDSLRIATDAGGDTIIWHFASKQAIDNIGRGGRLGSLAKALSRDGATVVSGIQILLSTDRSIATGARDHDFLPRVDHENSPGR